MNYGHRSELSVLTIKTPSDVWWNEKKINGVSSFLLYLIKNAVVEIKSIRKNVTVEPKHQGTCIPLGTLRLRPVSSFSGSSLH